MPPATAVSSGGSMACGQQVRAAARGDITILLVRATRERLACSSRTALSLTER